MKITGINVFELEGEARSDLAVFETAHPYLSNEYSDVKPHKQTFTEIVTDEGITGLCPRGSREVKLLGETLIGEDPLHIAHIWERLYSESYLRFQRQPYIGILELALWDIIGKARGEPVYNLLGGPSRERIPAYAAMLGFNSEPEVAAETSKHWVAKGFGGLKWYPLYNATDGDSGLRKTVALVEAIRDAVGDHVDIMLDFGISPPNQNNLLYLIKLSRWLEPYNITWIEEPLNIDDINAYRQLTQATSIPVAFGERWYDRWQFKNVLDSGAATVVQPDLLAALGITEVRRIIALASTYGIPVIPHANEACINTMHLLFAESARTCPMAEWGVKLNHNMQYFYKTFYEPVDGFFELPNGPGFGFEIDENKITQRRDL